MLQDFYYSVEEHNKEGVKHGEYHPNINHFNVGCGRKGLGDADETNKRQNSLIQEYQYHYNYSDYLVCPGQLFQISNSYEYYAYNVVRTRRIVRLTSMTISR